MPVIIICCPSVSLRGAKEALQQRNGAPMHLNDLLANMMSVTTIYAGAMVSRPHQRLAYLQDKEWFLTELTPIYSLQVTMNPIAML